MKTRNKKRNRVKQILYLYFLLLITSKIAIFATTLFEFLIANYIIFGFKFQMIPQLLLIHFILFIFVFGKIQNEMFGTRQKLHSMICFIKNKTEK
jgi:hypothetical protein